MNVDRAKQKDDLPRNRRDLDFELPPSLIAQHPLPRRDDSRMLVVDRTARTLRDSQITLLPDLLRAGDLLVLNDTKVLPARFVARRSTGGRVRGLFVAEPEPGTWQVMLEGSRRLKTGECLDLLSRTVDREDRTPSGYTVRLEEAQGQGHWHVRIDPAHPAEQVLADVGQTPLPPYIHRNATDFDSEVTDQDRYQTVYAKQSGAIAAPTAGLHLTDSMIDAIRSLGVQVAYVTLHVGVGTFLPIKEEELSRHVMHSEQFDLPAETASAITQCRRRQGRVVAVGTTCVRVLEAVAQSDESRTVQAIAGRTEIFIRPPYSFRVVDALLTNFHLPQSTLLALVMAMAGVTLTRSAYDHAIENHYRFFSYGDAMLIV